MRLKEEIILNEIDGQFVVVDARDTEERFNGIMKMNKTAGFIAQQLKKETDLEKTVKAVTEKYEVSEEQARNNVLKVIDSFRQVGLLEE